MKAERATCHERSREAEAGADDEDRAVPVRRLLVEVCRRGGGRAAGQGSVCVRKVLQEHRCHRGGGHVWKAPLDASGKAERWTSPRAGDDVLHDLLVLRQLRPGARSGEHRCVLLAPLERVPDRFDCVGRPRYSRAAVSCAYELEIRRRGDGARRRGAVSLRGGTNERRGAAPWREAFSPLNERTYRRSQISSCSGWSSSFSVDFSVEISAS